MCGTHALRSTPLTRARTVTRRRWRNRLGLQGNSTSVEERGSRLTHSGQAAKFNDGAPTRAELTEPVDVLSAARECAGCRVDSAPDCGAP
jgi:hypothetical protein